MGIARAATIALLWMAGYAAHAVRLLTRWWRCSDSNREVLVVSKALAPRPATPKNASAALQGRRFRSGRLEHQCVAQPHAKTARAHLDDLVGVVPLPGV
jgi:hypothetical protein